MSNSFRKRPFTTDCGGSQKKEKRFYNRAMRRVNKIALRVKGEEAYFFIKHEIMDVWSMPQDGTKHYDPFRAYLNLMGRIYPEKTDEELYRSWYKWTKAK